MTAEAHYCIPPLLQQAAPNRVTYPYLPLPSLQLPTLLQDTAGTQPAPWPSRLHSAARLVLVEFYICGGLATAAPAVQHSTPQPFRPLHSHVLSGPVLRVRAARSVMSGMSRLVVRRTCLKPLTSEVAFQPLLLIPLTRLLPSLLPAPLSSTCVG